MDKERITVLEGPRAILFQAQVPKTRNNALLLTFDLLTFEESQKITTTQLTLQFSSCPFFLGPPDHR